MKKSSNPLLEVKKFGTQKFFKLQITLFILVLYLQGVRNVLGGQLGLALCFLRWIQTPT